MVETTRQASLWRLTLILLLGAALRILVLTDFRLHPDEALFATLGRLIITGQDPLLTNTPLLIDKPPLFYYLLATGISIDWVNEMTPRIPGLFASFLSLALLGRLSYRLFQSAYTTVVTVLFVAVSPFAILFSPTAFADPLMVCFWLGACVSVVEGKWWVAGLLLGLSLATKQNTLFLAPMLLLLIPFSRSPKLVSGGLRALLGFSIVISAVISWDLQRVGIDSFWTSGLAYNNPGRLIRQDELLRRLLGWGNWLKYVFGGSLVGGLWIGIVVVGLAKGFKKRNLTANTPLVAVALMTFALYYLVLHWLVAFPLLDRYMLPLVPIFGLLLGWSVQYIRLRMVGTFMLGAMIIGVWQAAEGNVPVGSDKGTLDGIRETIDYISEYESGTVLYYQSLGWPLTYYLYDAPIFTVNYASPDNLQADLEAFSMRDSERLIVLSASEPQHEALHAITVAGFTYELVFSSNNQRNGSNFVVYSVQHPNPQ